MRHAFYHYFKAFTSKLYLLAEMLNMLDETSALIYLTDGGHIENLGLYELLKRGCETIIVVDAEADPELAFPSFLKLERYARIDLGIRIVLPWEAIAKKCFLSETASGRIPGVSHPPHCAVGRIFYEDGTEGVLLYFKTCVTGDEKDYILDYQRRNPSFPHESTGDQFFTEEQFEMHRALGYHMVDGFFSKTLPFAYLDHGDGSFPSAAVAFAAVDASVQTLANV